MKESSCENKRTATRIVKKPIRRAGLDLVTVTRHGSSLEIDRPRQQRSTAAAREFAVGRNHQQRFASAWERTSYNLTAGRRDMSTNSRGVSVIVT
jgi:hypothetical protein